MKLPKLKYTDNIKKYEQIAFSGINRKKGARDGSIYDLKDISVDDYPILSTSNNRYKDETKYKKPWFYGMADKPFVIAGEETAPVYEMWNPETQHTYKEGEIVVWWGKLYRRYYGEYKLDYDQEVVARTIPPMYCRERWEPVNATYQMDYVGSGDRCGKNEILWYEGKRFRGLVDTPLFTDYNSEGNDKNWEYAGTVEELFPKYKGYWNDSTTYHLGDIVTFEENVVYHYYELVKELTPGTGITGAYYPWKYSDNGQYSDSSLVAYWHEVERPWRIWDIGNDYKVGDIAIFRGDVSEAENLRLYDTCRKNVTGVNYKNRLEPYKYATLYYDGKPVEGLELEPSKKECIFLNGYILIFPDKMYYNTKDGKFGYLEGNRLKSFQIWTEAFGSYILQDAPTYENKPPYLYRLLSDGELLTYRDYTLNFYVGSSEKIIKGCSGQWDTIKLSWGNTDKPMMIIAPTAEDGNLTGTYYSFKEIFREGDVLKVDPYENGEYAVIVPGYYVVREVGHDYLRFDSGVFAGVSIPSNPDNDYRNNGYYRLHPGLRIIKQIPDMDYFCNIDNRIWGCKDDTVYASGLGNPFSWNSYTGLETDSIYIDAGTIDKFTGCCAYNGYPYFFKENEMYRVYGSTPAGYSLQRVGDIGIKSGSPHSVCSVNSILMFLSPKGIYAYAGGVPGEVSGNLNNFIYDCIASTNGLKYYGVMTVGNEKRLYVYDVVTGVWTSEHFEGEALGFAWYENDLRCMNTAGEIFTVSRPTGKYGTEIKEINDKAVIEFNDFYGGSIGTKDIGKIILRASVEPEHNALYVYVQYDSDGIWHRVGKIYNQNTRKKVCEFGFFPRRCDHFRIKLECQGKFTLYSMAREISNNS